VLVVAPLLHEPRSTHLPAQPEVTPVQMIQSSSLITDDRFPTDLARFSLGA
jgi:hypothetical protein